MSSAKANRISQEMRTTIISNVETHTFKERNEALRTRMSIIGNRVLDFVIGSDNLLKMKALSPEFFNSRDCFTLKSKEDRVFLRLIEARRVPAYLAWGDIELDKANGMWKELRAVNAEANAIAEASKELRENLSVTLAAFNSVAKLVAAWPDIEQHVPKVDVNTNLPAVRIDDINAMIAKFSKKPS